MCFNLSDGRFGSWCRLAARDELRLLDATGPRSEGFHDPNLTPSRALPFDIDNSCDYCLGQTWPFQPQFALSNNGAEMSFGYRHK